MHVLVHYDEIALKRGKRRLFEEQLLEQIRNRLNTSDAALDCTRIIAETPLKQEKVAEELSGLFGVKNYAFPLKVEPDIDALRDATQQLLKGKEGSVAVDAKRADKGFDYTSQEIQEELGDVAVDLGFSIDLDNPDVPVFVEVTEENAYVYDRKYNGPGGLPVGSAGDVLCLLSGGIDSPVAAWLMMKRGCNVDFLHFNPYASPDKALEKKLGKVVDVLNMYQRGCDVFFAPYGVYQLSADVDAEYDLVAFRHCMLRCAVQLARQKGYEGVVTGDSVAQVASQTLQNLNAVGVGIDYPVFRPLIGYDKDEIIDVAREIGTYEASIGEYKDCCSIIADSPNTAVGRESMVDVLDDVDMGEIVDRTLDEVVCVSVE